jgi:hypothetical protein
LVIIGALGLTTFTGGVAQQSRIRTMGRGWLLWSRLKGCRRGKENSGIR